MKIEYYTENKIKKIFIIFSFIASILFFTVMFIYTGFKLSAPLDDAFIYFQYAKNLSKGYFFEYVPGDGYSSGATSFLYALLLTPFTFILRGSSLIIIVTYFLGGVCLFLSGYFIYKILKKLNVDNLFSIFGGVFFITNGNILWGYFSGMEIPLFATLIVINLYYILNEKIKEQLIFLSLLSIVRPEGFFLVTFYLIIKFLNLFLDKKLNKINNIYIFLIPLIPGIIYFIINKIFTGYFMPNTMRAKSDFAMYYPVWLEILRNGLQKYFDFLLNVYNGEHEHWFLHYSFFVFLFAILSGISEEIISKKLKFFSVSFIWFFAGTLSTVFSSFFNVHNYRYAMPFMIIFVLVFVYGLFYLLEGLNYNFKTKKNTFYFSVIFLLLLFNFFTVLANIINFGRDCRAICNQSISAGLWIKKNLPKDARVAINDIGAITFFSDAKIYDLVGLVTNKQAEVFRSGIASVYEKIEKVKPDYFMIHLGWFNYEKYSFFGLSDKRLVTFNLDIEPPYYVVGSPEVCVKLKTELLDSGDTIKNNTLINDFNIIDKIDICDLTSEQEHKYKIWTYFPPDMPDNLLEEGKDKYTDITLIDGGREVIGGETFYVYN
ncbi:MAG: glucosyltransferase domain-containing protein, partial [Candidatus Goldbacteria bacterium]|nr:glucosyltransferase domain-containing protein [Candidatus Goldiibacteriota bacterium]